MASQVPNLTWLRTFEAAARLRGFSAAGAELGLTQSAVSQQIRALETRLRSTLFIRGGRRLELTDVAKAYLPSVRRAIEELGFVTDGIFGPATARSVTVYAPTSVAVSWLAPRLPQFAAQAPDVSVKLLSSIWSDVPTGSDVDLELRMLPVRSAQVSTTPLFGHTLIAVCAPAMEGRIRAAADLRQERRVHVQGFDDHWTRFFNAAGIDATAASAGYTVDSSLAALEVVAAGGGVAVVLHAFADLHLRSGRVVQAIDHTLELDTAHYLIEHQRTQPRRRETAQFRDWLETLPAAG